MRWLVIFVSVMCAASVCASVTETIDLDKRLDKKVTIEVIHTKLADVAAELTKQTGITIKAGTSVKDWKPRERKVTIQAKDVPAGDLVKEIAHLLGFQLTVSGKEPAWTYSFWQDRKSRLAEDEAVTAGEKAGKERYRKALQGALDVADQALGMTSAEAMAKKASSPWLAFLGGTDSGRALSNILSYFNKQCPDDRSLFLSGKAIDLETADLPPDVQQAVRDAGKSPLAQFGDDGAEEGYTEVTRLTIEPSNVDYAQIIAGEIQFVSAGSVLAPDGSSEQESYVNYMGSLPIAGSDSAIGNMLGEFALELESGRDPDELAAEMESRLDPAEFAEAFFHRESSTEKNPPTDPELTREIEIKEFRKEVGEPFDVECGPEDAGLFMKELARATGWSVLFESFDELNNLTSLVVLGKQPLYKVLIALEKAGYLWERGEGTLRIRPDDWLTRRAPEISEALIAQYMRLYDKQGRLTLDDVAALVSSLTDTQLVKGLNRTDLGEIVDWQVQDPDGPGVRDILRLYRSMTPAQKAALVSESSLRISQLTADQVQRLKGIIARELPNITMIYAVIDLKFSEDATIAHISIAVLKEGATEHEMIEHSLYLPLKEPPYEEPPPTEEEQP